MSSSNEAYEISKVWISKRITPDNNTTHFYYSCEDEVPQIEPYRCAWLKLANIYYETDPNTKRLGFRTFRPALFTKAASYITIFLPKSFSPGSIYPESEKNG